MESARIPVNKPIGDVSTELSSRRTGMSFHRTRLSADRTLMSVIRTALSLISFGFTIYQLFSKLYDQGMIGRPQAGRNFGSALVLLGIAMLSAGIVYHVMFMLGLRGERKSMKAAGLVHAETKFPPSFTLVTAILLLLIGIVTGISMVFRVGPFS